MAIYEATVTDYSTADKFCTHDHTRPARTRKIAHNTMVVPVFHSPTSELPTHYVVTYHGNQVAKFFKCAPTMGRPGVGHALFGERYISVLDTCGWDTVTTWERLNNALDRRRYGVQIGGHRDTASRFGDTIARPMGDDYPVQFRRLYLQGNDGVIAETPGGRFLRVTNGHA